MTVAPAALPDNPADLQQYCLQLLATLAEKQQLIDKLSHQLTLFRRYLYGRRSEQLDPAQLLLEFASWVTSLNAAPAAPPEPPAAPASPRARPGHGRTPLPALLPRRRVEHALPEERCACTACGARLIKIGEETSEQLDYQPASLYVTEHVRFTYACKACEGTVVTAERAAAPIEKGRPGPGLLAQVITAKYADHGVPRMPTEKGGNAAGEMRGGPLGVGVQDQAPNHLTLRWSRASVVNGEGNGAHECVRYGSGRRTRVNRR